MEPLSRSAELRTVNGQTQFLPKRRVSRNGSLPSLTLPGGTGTGAGGNGSSGPSRLSHVSSAPQLPKTSVKQRGVFSEVVKPHRSEEVDSCKLGPLPPDLTSDAAASSGSTWAAPRPMRKSASASTFKLSKGLRHKAAEALPTDPKQVTTEIAPKVVEVYAHRPGDRPRKVTVERRKKWFESLDVEGLLMQRGISFRPPNWSASHWMHLDEFDNREYDIREPEEWIRSGVNADGEFLPLRAQALRLKEDGGGTWEDCVCYGTHMGKFSVRWKDGEESTVGRLQIIFFGEDPEVFADRLLFAFQALHRAQSRAQLNFFIDNMPIDDIQCLDIDQVARVLDLARSSALLKDSSMEPAANDLIREVNLDFARTMNKIIFVHDQEVQSHAREEPELPNSDIGKEKEPGIFSGVNICDLEDDEENLFERPVPWFSLWPLPEYNFTQTFSSFCFSSLFIKPEVVSTLCGVATECLWLLHKCQYVTRFEHVLKVDMFKQTQRSHIGQTAKDIREIWVANIIKIIQKNFENVEKGWFSIHETNQDTYAEGKVKKLLYMVRLMMEDTLRYFMLDSVEDYCRALEYCSPAEVNVAGLLDVSSTFHGPRKPVEPQVRGGSLELQPPGRGPSPAELQAMIASGTAPQPATGIGSVGGPGAGDPSSSQPLENAEEQHQRPSCLKAGDGLFALELKAVPAGGAAGALAVPAAVAGGAALPAEGAVGTLTFAYSADGSQIVDVCDELLETALLSLSDVPQVESSIVPQLFKTMVHKKTLNCPDTHNKWIVARRSQLRDALQHAIPCLEDFLKLFDEHEDLLNMKPEELVAAKVEAEITLEEAKQCIVEHVEKEQAVLAAIPDSTIVGLCQVNCIEVKKMLAAKHRKTVDLFLEMLSTRFRDTCQGLCDAYNGIFAALRKAPKDIEGIAELRDYMGSVPNEVAKMAVETKRCLDTFGSLEGYGIKLSSDDYHQRWRVFGLPKETHDLMSKTEDTLKEAEQSFLDLQAQEQTDFDENLVDLAQIIDSFARYDDIEKIDETYESVESVNDRLKEAAVKAKLFNSRETLFGKETTDYSQVQTLTKEWEPFSQLWVTAYQWTKDSKKWYSGAFEKIDPKQCETWVMGATKTLFKAVKTFEKREGDAQVAKILEITKDIKNQVDDFAPKVPIIVGLRNNGMRERHWEQVSELCGSEVSPQMESFTLDAFLELGMQEHAQEVADIGDRSGKELGIEIQLKAMQSAWDKVAFDCTEPYRTTGTYILKGADEVLALLDEQIVMTQAMQFSPFNKPFKEEIDEWNDKLVYVSECLDQWLKVQRAWMYLQPIFDSPDIMKQLPTEGKKFQSVDKKWKGAMAKCNKDGHALTRLSEDELLKMWQNANSDLDLVQKGLDDYLETKRGAFARFYFLSNDELLEILSQTKDPLRVQPFLSKVFEAMKQLTFTDELVATQMHSKEGEIIDFVTPVKTNGKNVEMWMTEVEEQMLASCRNVIRIGVESYPETLRTDWVQQHPGQVVLNSSQVHWTAEVEEAIGNAALSDYHAQLKEQLLGLVRLVRGDITKLQRMSIGALVVIDVHAMDTVEKMAAENISDPMSFEWISQLRYYWEMDDRQSENLQVRMVQTLFPYGYEYLGNSFRLVITPLTDMCYMTLMGAQSLNLGGAPAGPAGTGKTETTKDLAKALAKQCVVFNCSPEMDYLMVGKFFKGLSSSGAWCCFDEFNRINIEVLSVIAQQLLQLFGAKKELKSYNEAAELEFDGTLIQMRPTFNVFITMNPGYAGRSELPDNLAALFRPMAMMVPDYGLIGEISFYAFGFEEGRHLAKKMVTTFQLCSEQLSAQSHYDYGMRAVKTVIEAAGLNKRKYPEQSEGQILLRALRDVNVPKFLRDDLPLFENIIEDLFPGVVRPQMDYGQLKESCETCSSDRHLQPTDYFIKKQFELFDMIQVRHGMMLVGPTGGGKTECYRALQAACTRLVDPKLPESPYQKTHVHVLNPKAITQNQLYGSFDEVTREWSDGVAAELIRNAVRDNANPDNHWIMFDGPVDALWIESMNTVLDDNKKLCLVSGEIIALTSKMRMQFEVEDLEVASPATVSRCGMIYMEPESLGYDVFFQSWVEQLPETFSFQPTYAETLLRLSSEIVPPTLTFARKSLVEVVKTQDNNLIQSLFRLLDCYFVNFVPNELKPAASFKEAIKEFQPALIPLFFFCLVWSIGASCTGATRGKFSKFVWAMISQEHRDELAPELEKAWIPLPPFQEGVEFVGLELGADMFDYFYSIEEKAWMPWMDTIPKYEVPRSAKYEEIVVPSLDSVRLVYIFQLLVLNDKHVLCPGPTGTGKSVNIGLWLQKTAPEHIQGTFINFSAQTHVNQLQDLIDSKLEKRRRGVYGPPAGKKMVLFIDDLNMPLKEYYGAQPPIELVRQWHDHRGWFNRKELVKFNIVDVIMVSAMGPPGGGRTFITERLKRHYSTTAYSDFSDSSITQMFNTISGYFFSNFDEKVQALIPSMISSTIDVFKQALEDLLPTPSKSHYLFNLRDIWKVFLGLCSLNSRKSNDTMSVIRCWCHEVQRVFGDRLTDQQDLGWMRTQLDKHIVDDFSLKSEDVFASDRLIFASFMTQEVENRVYEEITDLKQMKETIEEYLDDYNNVNTITMPLVMFLDACEHCARICRVLTQPSGNVLLLGVGGSGRQSLTRLSAFTNDVECFQIEVAKGYGMVEFKDDLKKCLMRCGVEDKVQIFLFCDTQIVKEDFVEAVNNVLNSGDVPNLYANEDFEGISSSCRALCQSLGMQPTKANLFSAYLTRVKKNVHVTLAFSPVGDSFRNRLRMFPSLVNCCTIDWFHEWPAEALYSVAKQQLQTQNVELPDLEGALRMFQSIHQSVEVSSKKFLKQTNRQVYITPTSYLELLSSFVKILADKREQVETQKTRYSVGLTKIMDAEEAVAGLQQMLVDKKPELEKTQKEVGEMMIVIKKDKADAEEVSIAVAAEEATASKKADEVQVVKDDAQRDLDEALPALDEAVQCLKKLKITHIQEIKVLANPPGGVRLACEACCVMFGLKPVKKNAPDGSGKKIDDFWETSQKSLLADPKKLLEDLMDYDKDNIPENRINTMTGYMEREDFDPAAIKKASIACEAMCLWARAMYKYHFIAKAVEPKRQMLRQAEKELGECQEKLDKARTSLQEVQDKIAKLESDFSAAVAKQDELQADMDLCEVKLVRAHKLIGGLGGEKARWGQNVKDLSSQLSLLPGDCIVAAGMVSYVGPFTSAVRTDCEEMWRRELTEIGIQHNEGCSMRTVLGEPVKIQQWVVASLPNDALSIENGIIIDRSRRWPLCIDPQRQANKFIKNMGKDTETGIDVCKLSEKNFLRTLELGIQFGKWILLENIGINLDPALEPVLQQQKVKDGSGFTIRLGDKSITYSDTFKFFMTTTLPNPHYSPETSVKVTLLNFAITPQGLEDQMLGIVVAKERPDLEEQKNELVVQNAKMNKMLKEIEDDILRLLATSEGDVLEDDTLVNKVTSSKEVSDDINQKKEVAKVTEENIDTARESYRPVAYRTAVLFFCIVELTNIDPMYQYSLQWFQKLFTIAIDNSPKSDVFEERLEILKDFFTESLYQNICRGLFEKDKTLFSFALCTRIMKGDNNIDDAELRYLLVGPTSDMVENGPPIPADWVGKPRWNEVLTLATLPAFQGFDKTFESQLDFFKNIYDSVEADKEALPGEWETKLTPLERLCFIRAMRMDCLKSAIITFISAKIGTKFVEPPTFDIAKSFADSINTTPLIFILSPGTDPVSDVITFAEKMGVAKRFESISLGQGQGPKATKMIENAQGTGGWVLLSNCHLMESWMSTLEAIVEQLNPEAMSTNFRLWLTSMPAKSFPVQVLQNGVKMTNEPPSGLRANLLRSYSVITDELFKQSEKPEVFKALLFGFCFFHAVVQDRRKFGPIGWNIPYGFTPEDLQVCKEQLMLFVNQYEEIPYKVLNFLGAKINYGGRVTDDKDKLLISTILKVYICQEVVKDKSEYKYSASGIYHAPDAESVQEVIDYIRTFPLYPMPEAFGLHANCDITCAQDEALRLLVGMQSMVQLGGGGKGAQSAEDVMDEQAASIQERLPAPYPLDICETKFPTLYEESMNTVVKQECLRYNKLLWCMASSLKDFRKAIKGLIVMTGELEALGKSLFVNEQPELWISKGPLSLKPLSSWYLDILSRCEFFQMWFDLGKAPPCFWISGIFFPQAFFTGAMQNFARKYNEEIDLLSFRQTMRDDIVDPVKELTKPPEDGVYIYGIFMEGCRWDSDQHQLADSRPKELFTDLPSLWFCPIKNRVPEILDYRCPCYKVVSRKGTLLTTGHSTNFVLYIELKTDTTVDKWIKAGVAAFLALKF